MIAHLRCAIIPIYRDTVTAFLSCRLQFGYLLTVFFADFPYRVREASCLTISMPGAKGGD